MIDENRTAQLFGYTSDVFGHGSHKKVVAVCEECGTYRVVQKRYCMKLCISCAKKNPSEATRWKISEANKKRAPISEATRLKQSKTNKNISNETRRKMSAAAKRQKPTEDTRIKRSCTMRGITINEFGGFATDSPYCDKFTNACRERNREKYDRQCFLCNKTEAENEKKLSVHHVDMNKQQGCDSHEWKLVPLCASCHSRAHSDIWQARIEYILGRIV